LRRALFFCGLGLLLMPGTGCATPACTGDRSAVGPSAQIVLLGTHGGPVEGRNSAQPASLLIVDGRLYLIDAGEAVSHQLVLAGYHPPQIARIFLTHHHADHDAGLPPLLSLIWFERGQEGKNGPPIDIYGPPATRFLTDMALRYLSVSERIFRAGMPHFPPAAPNFRAHDIDASGAVLRDRCVTVRAVENSHFAHRSVGPDGQVDRSFSYRFDTKAGSIVFTGDTGPSAAVTRLASGADVLVSEVYVTDPGAKPDAKATPLSREMEEHMRREHLTPAQVGEMARAAHVRTVILTHIVGPQAPGRVAALVKRRFRGTVVEGTDLLRYKLPR